MSLLCQNLRAPHDRNGNPGRLWLVLGPSGSATVIDEGYEGRPAACRGRPDATTINILRGEYRRILSTAKRHGGQIG